MFEPAIEWLKEYGDVLGGIGSIMALTMLLITNGRVILDRFRGKNTHMPFPVTGGAKRSGSLNGAAGIENSIAILPFTELGRVTQHFADGAMHDLVADMRQAGYVIPATDTTQKLASSGSSAQEIAQQLNVCHVLTASVRQQDDKIRINAQLVDTSGATEWSHRFDVSGNDIMAMQETIAENIATTLTGHLAGDQLPAQGPQNIPATIDLASHNSTALQDITNVSPKSRFIAFMLCFVVVGLFGAHRFYVGRPFTGILYVFTAGLFTFGWLFDLILISLGMFADGKGRTVKLFYPQRTVKP